MTMMMMLMFRSAKSEKRNLCKTKGHCKLHHRQNVLFWILEEEKKLNHTLICTRYLQSWQDERRRKYLSQDIAIWQIHRLPGYAIWQISITGCCMSETYHKSIHTWQIPITGCFIANTYHRMLYGKYLSLDALWQIPIITGCFMANISHRMFYGKYLSCLQTQRCQSSHLGLASHPVTKLFWV